MAADLASTPDSGLEVQLCGDAHLVELRDLRVARAPPDLRRQRLRRDPPRSVGVGRQAPVREPRGGGPRQRVRRPRAHPIVRRAVRAYRETMRDLAPMPMLDVWYARLDMDELLPRFRALLDPKATPSVWRAVTKARAHDSHQAFEKLCNGRGRRAADRQRPAAHPAGGGAAARPDGRPTRVDGIQGSYRRDPGVRPAPAARAVPGRPPGPQGRRRRQRGHRRLDPAAPRRSRRAAAPAGQGGRGLGARALHRPSAFEHHGQRVVAGQRLMQAASDIFLGWERLAWDGRPARLLPAPAARLEGVRRRGGHDARRHGAVGPDVRVDARPRARPLGRPGRDRGLPRQVRTFDRAIAAFAAAYADQNERDYAAFCEAVASGRLEATTGL